MAHYTKLWRYGDAEIPSRASPGSVLKWIRAHKNHRAEACLKWPFAMDRNGYGLATYKGQQKTASNVMCLIAHGPPPSKKHECAHSCGKGNKGCVNPRHLRWATRQENHQDKHAHGTMPIGESHRWAKLTTNQVREIRAQKGKVVGSDLARSYNVDPGAIYAIWNRRTWAWLE